MVTIIPMDFVVLTFKLRATALGEYFKLLMACITASSVSFATKRVLLITWETVVVETPAIFATSLIVAIILPLENFSYYKDCHQIG